MSLMIDTFWIKKFMKLEALLVKNKKNKNK